MEVSRVLSVKNLQESYHDAVYCRDEIRSLFEHGLVSLRERAVGERIFWNIVLRVADFSGGSKYVPDELEGIQAALADVYHSNFSVFQSLPDVWAIDQLFPSCPSTGSTNAPRAWAPSRTSRATATARSAALSTSRT